MYSAKWYLFSVYLFLNLQFSILNGVQVFSSLESNLQGWVRNESFENQVQQMQEPKVSFALNFLMQFSN